DVRELPIDRGEPDKGHLVQRTQLLHHQVAYDAAGDLEGVTSPQIALDLIDYAGDGLRADRPLRAGLLQARAELLAVELLPPTVLLDQDQVRELRPLVG